MQQSTRQLTGCAPGAMAARSQEQVHPASLCPPDLTDLLEELDTAVIVCCEEGRVKLANNAARYELLGDGPLTVNTKGLLSLSASAQAALLPWRSALHAAAVLHRRQLLALHDGKRTLMVSVMPLGQQAPWVLVMLGRRQPAPDLAVQMLSKLFELTNAEQRVLVSLLGGQRVEAIARERGVKLSTLRTQVCTLREKLGASRLEDLVRLACELPPMSSALRSPALWGCNQRDSGRATLGSKTPALSLYA
jgi:DNA-binding CsgD family transcriptional regulator